MTRPGPAAASDPAPDRRQALRRNRSSGGFFEYNRAALESLRTATCSADQDARVPRQQFQYQVVREGAVEHPPCTGRAEPRLHPLPEGREVSAPRLSRQRAAERASATMQAATPVTAPVPTCEPQCSANTLADADAPDRDIPPPPQPWGYGIVFTLENILEDDDGDDEPRSPFSPSGQSNWSFEGMTDTSASSSPLAPVTPVLPGTTLNTPTFATFGDAFCTTPGVVLQTPSPISSNSPTPKASTFSQATLLQASAQAYMMRPPELDSASDLRAVAQAAVNANTHVKDLITVNRELLSRADSLRERYLLPADELTLRLAAAAAAAENDTMRRNLYDTPRSSLSPAMSADATPRPSRRSVSSPASPTTSIRTIRTRLSKRPHSATPESTGSARDTPRPASYATTSGESSSWGESVHTQDEGDSDASDEEEEEDDEAAQPAVSADTAPTSPPRGGRLSEERALKAFLQKIGITSHHIEELRGHLSNMQGGAAAATTTTAAASAGRRSRRATARFSRHYRKSAKKKDKKARRSGGKAEGPGAESVTTSAEDEGADAIGAVMADAAPRAPSRADTSSSWESFLADEGGILAHIDTGVAHAAALAYRLDDLDQDTIDLAEVMEAVLDTDTFFADYLE